MKLRRALELLRRRVERFDDVGQLKSEQLYELRRTLHTYLQPIFLEPHPDGYLIAKLALDGQRLALNKGKIEMVAVARLSNYMQIEIEPFPLVVGG